MSKQGHTDSDAFDKDTQADKDVDYDEEPSPLEQWVLWSPANALCVHQFMSK
jgi:hypothetical protein